MTDLTVRTFEMFVRVAGFLVSNPSIFRKGSQGPRLVEKFKQAVGEIRDLTTDQVTEIAVARASSGARSNARDALVEAMARIARCAMGLSVTITGLDDKFRMPWHSGDAVLLARAHSFAENAAQHRKDFVNFDMAPDFVDDLNSKIKAFEQAFSDHTASKTAHVATSREIDDAVQRAGAILIQLDPIIDNNLVDNSVLMSKWKNVRHTERAWSSRRKKPDPQPVPTPEPGPGTVPIVPAA